MLALFTRVDKNYGGMDYLEVNHSNKTYRKGNTRSHSGFTKGEVIKAEVKTLKVLKELQLQLDLLGYLLVK